MLNSFTHWKDNIAKEEKHAPFSMEQVKKQLAHLFQVNSIKTIKVDDVYMQKRGVDFISDVEGKLITVDVKVRENVERYWGDNSTSQDIAIEYKQTDEAGWANNESYVTDYVLWAYPDLKNKKYRDSILLPHDFCKWLTTGPRLDIILNDPAIPKRKGKNQAGCYSYFFCLNMDQINEKLDEYYGKIKV
jgi:hypothetical protein